MEKQEKILDDVNAKYDEANQGKLEKCRERLNEIAMRPQTMPSEEYLQQMIENEKNSQDIGWQNRMAALEKVKSQTKTLRNAEKPAFSTNLVARFTGDEKIQPVAHSSKRKAVQAFGNCGCYNDQVRAEC